MTLLKKQCFVLEDTASEDTKVGEGPCIDGTLDQASPSTIYVSFQDEKGDDHFTVAVDFFDGDLRVLVWQVTEQGNDPGVEVVCKDVKRLLP